MLSTFQTQPGDFIESAGPDSFLGLGGPCQKVLLGQAISDHAQIAQQLVQFTLELYYCPIVSVSIPILGHK